MDFKSELSGIWAHASVRHSYWPYRRSAIPCSQGMWAGYRRMPWASSVWRHSDTLTSENKLVLKQKPAQHTAVTSTGVEADRSGDFPGVNLGQRRPGQNGNPYLDILKTIRSNHQRSRWASLNKAKWIWICYFVNIVPLTRALEGVWESHRLEGEGI